MSFFTKPTKAPLPKTKNAVIVGGFLAVVLLVMVGLQLASYEDFIPLLGQYALPLSEAGVTVLAAIIVFSELLAIPFLLRARLSPGMRLLSMVAGWFVIVLWFLLQIWLNHPTTYGVGVTPVFNTGILGAGLTVNVGWGIVLFFAALGTLAGWAAWGMWPVRHHKK